MVSPEDEELLADAMRRSFVERDPEYIKLMPLAILAIVSLASPGPWALPNSSFEATDGDLLPNAGTDWESLIGAGMQTELVADGIDPALVAHEVGDAFHDPVVDPADAGQPCASGDRCPPGTVCTGASSFRPGQCREEIPVIVSQHMVELYNGAFRRAYRAAYEAWRKGDRSVLFPAGTWWLVRGAGATAGT